MPDTGIEIVTKEWLQAELRSSTKDLIILDCRSSNEYTEGHIRSAVNFSIPTIMLRRLAAGKIDMLSTIKSRELKERIQSGYKCSLFVLYNENSNFAINGCESGGGSSSSNENNSLLTVTTAMSTGEDCDDDTTSGADNNGDGNIAVDIDNNQMDFVDGDLTTSKCHYYHANIGDTTTAMSTDRTSNNCSTMSGESSSSKVNFNNSASGNGSSGGSFIIASNTIGMGDPTNTSTINMLHRRLKQDGCRVVCLQGGYSHFRNAFPEWCEDDTQNQEMESSRGTTQADQLMGLRSLRISTPHSDSACSSSTESSDCESISHYHHHHYHHHHHNANEAPVEIVPGLFLGNASHSGDSSALQKYNIKYVLNVTPDLPNHFEASGCGIQYLQIPITDHYSQDLAVHFPAAIRFIEEARSKGSAVLVHCLAGVSRSVTVTLAYLMHTRSLCLNDAFSLVRDRKPDVAPNFHFMEQLHSFERQLKISPNHHHHHDYHHSRHHHHHCHNSDVNDSSSVMMSSSPPPSSSSSLVSESGSGSSSSTSSAATICEKCPQQQQQQQRTTSKLINTTICSNCSLDNDDSCKCMQTDFLIRAKATGVSPDSGIEFDRWTPSSDIGGNSGGGGGNSSSGCTSMSGICDSGGDDSGGQLRK